MVRQKKKLDIIKPTAKSFVVNDKKQNLYKLNPNYSISKSQSGFKTSAVNRLVDKYEINYYFSKLPIQTPQRELICRQHGESNSFSSALK